MQQFEIRGRVPVDDGRFVTRVDEAQTLSPGHFAGMGRGLGQGGPCHDDLCAEVAHRVHLDGRGALGHDDDGVRARDPRGERDGLRMVARRGGDEAGRTFVGVEACGQGQAAAHLERARGLHVLVLDDDIAADGPRQALIAPRRGDGQALTQALRSGEDAVEGHWSSRSGHERHRCAELFKRPIVTVIVEHRWHR